MSFEVSWILVGAAFRWLIDYSFLLSSEYPINRQSHNSFFEKSDLFFLCMLRPLSSEIQVQRLEIEGAQVC
jgi:hypothetical protein